MQNIFMKPLPDAGSIYTRSVDLHPCEGSEPLQGLISLNPKAKSHQVYKSQKPEISLVIGLSILAGMIVKVAVFRRQRRTKKNNK